MRLYLIAALLVTALFFQVTLLNFVSIWGVKPDLVLLVVVFNAFLRGPREGALVGFLGGLFEDLATGSYIGMNALSTMAAGYLVGLTESSLYKDSSLMVVFLVWVSSVSVQVINYILLSTLGVFISPGAALFNVVIPTATYTAVLAPLFYGRFYRSHHEGRMYNGKI